MRCGTNSTVSGGVLEGRRGYPQGWFRGVGPLICQLVPHLHLGDARQMLTLHKPRGRRLRSRESQDRFSGVPAIFSEESSDEFLVVQRKCSAGACCAAARCSGHRRVSPSADHRGVGP